MKLSLIELMILMNLFLQYRSSQLYIIVSPIQRGDYNLYSHISILCLTVQYRQRFIDAFENGTPSSILCSLLLILSFYVHHPVLISNYIMIGDRRAPSGHKSCFRAVSLALIF